MEQLPYSTLVPGEVAHSLAIVTVSVVMKLYKLIDMSRKYTNGY